MIPDEALLVCTTPRSGSTWFCDLVMATGQFGRPLEFFNRAAEHAYRVRLGRQAMSEYPRVFDYILRKGTTGNRRFGAKILFNQLRDIEHYFHSSGECRGQDALAILLQQLRRVRIIRLKREDVVRQAISLHRAYETREWMRTDLHVLHRRYETRFDYHAIRKFIILLKQWNDEWERRLCALDVPQHEVTYAQMRRDLAGTMASAYEFLGIDSVVETKSTLEIQSDRSTDEWVEEFLTIDRGRTSQTTGLDLSLDRRRRDASLGLVA